MANVTLIPLVHLYTIHYSTWKMRLYLLSCDTPILYECGLQVTFHNRKEPAWFFGVPKKYKYPRSPISHFFSSSFFFSAPPHTLLILSSDLHQGSSTSSGLFSLMPPPPCSTWGFLHLRLHLRLHPLIPSPPHAWSTTSCLIHLMLGPPYHGSTISCLVNNIMLDRQHHAWSTSSFINITSYHGTSLSCWTPTTRVWHAFDLLNTLLMEALLPTLGYQWTGESPTCLHSGILTNQLPHSHPQRLHLPMIKPHLSLEFWQSPPTFLTALTVTVAGSIELQDNRHSGLWGGRNNGRNNGENASIAHGFWSLTDYGSLLDSRSLRRWLFVWLVLPIWMFNSSHSFSKLPKFTISRTTRP